MISVHNHNMLPYVSESKKRKKYAANYTIATVYSSYVTADIPHPCSLFAWSDFFLLELPSWVVFWLNQIVRDLRGFLSLAGVDKKERKKEREKEREKERKKIPQIPD